MASDTAPYPVTIALATVAWLFTSTTDEILKAPYLVYSVNSATNTNNGSLVDTTIILTNITHDKSYKNVTVALTVAPPDEIILDDTHGVRPVQPSWEGDTAPSITKDSFQHTFPIIQPDGRFEIIFTHHGPDTRYVHLTMKYLDSKTADAVLLTEQNLSTWLAENHTWLSVTAMCVLLALLLLSGMLWLCGRLFGRKETLNFGSEER